jgi:two-component system cell cycle response regulator
MSKQVLVVDDSIVMRNALEDVLVNAGFSVTTAPNGIEGLELMHSRKFDLLFLDIDMPNLSGLQVCRMLRNDPTFRAFPIIMLTARDKKKDEFWGLETGADAYLTKPFEPDKLLNTVDDVLEKIGQTPSLSEAADKLRGDEESKDLIFSAGEVQERQLFKMTLINRIFAIATTHRTLRDTCCALNHIYSSVIDYDIGMALITDDDAIKMFIFINKPINKDFLQATRNRIIEEFQDKTGRRIIRDNVEVIIEDPNHNILKVTEEKRILGFTSRLMEGKGEKFGVFCLSRAGAGPFNEDEMEMAAIISNQSNLVVDNIRMYEKIQRFAIADGLTGLYNHRYFQEQLEKEYSRARRFNLSLSLIMLDIDHFKRFNDKHGHQQGDVILKELARVTEQNVREIDLVARYGGEEFAIILPETPKHNVMVAAERIRTALEQHPFPHEPEPLHVTVSMGVSGYPDDNIETRLDLISKADLALYKAKREGRNRVCLYSTDLEVDIS